MEGALGCWVGSGSTASQHPATDLRAGVRESAGPRLLGSGEQFPRLPRPQSLLEALGCPRLPRGLSLCVPHNHHPFSAFIRLAFLLPPRH